MKKEYIVITGSVITMRNKYKKFTPADKEEHVKEYLRLSDTIGISQRKYAAKYEIPITTFKRWIRQYREFMSSQPLSVVVNSSSGSFIMISEEKQISGETSGCNIADASQGIRLLYKDAILEFQPDQLQEVMEILRLW